MINGDEVNLPWAALRSKNCRIVKTGMMPLKLKIFEEAEKLRISSATFTECEMERGNSMGDIV